MAVAVITGSCGLIGSEAAKHFHNQGLDIVGIDNDTRGYFFGKEASTNWQRAELERTLPRIAIIPKIFATRKRVSPYSGVSRKTFIWLSILLASQVMIGLLKSR